MEKRIAVNLLKNGYVVATLDPDSHSYHSWPLSDLTGDKTAEAFYDEAFDTWYVNYHMQSIVPDLTYIRRYTAYCKSIGLDAVVLLFETPDDFFVVEDELEIIEVLGYDCIATVSYSFLQTEIDACQVEFEERGIVPNKYGLLERLEDVEYFIELRQEVIASGVNIEDFWPETPARISIVNLA